MTGTKKYKVVLTDEDIEEINRKLRYSREQCAKRNGVCVSTVVHTASKFSEHGLKEALSSKRSVNSDNSRRKLDGRAEAKIIEIATGSAPEGHARWTLRLLSLP